MAYTGWQITETDRLRLLTLFPPVYPDIIAHHVTCVFGVSPFTDAPTEASGVIVGEVQTDGVQALIVRIAGTIYRPDGAIYHITWSIDRSEGRKPVDSNHVIATYGFKTVRPIIVELMPMVFV